MKDLVHRLSKILENDKSYKPEAYLFVVAALGRVLQTLREPRHVTGRELLEAIREEAEEQFGPMARAVFEHWGAKNSLDFGVIVFKMVDEGILSKTETDSLDDFKDAVFFESLFDNTSGYQLKEGRGSASYRNILN